MNPSVIGADVDACFTHFTRRVGDLALANDANRYASSRPRPTHRSRRRLRLLSTTKGREQGASAPAAMVLGHLSR